jgi:hypothetical protein
VTALQQLPPDVCDVASWLGMPSPVSEAFGGPGTLLNPLVPLAAQWATGAQPPAVGSHAPSHPVAAAAWAPQHGHTGAGAGAAAAAASPSAAASCPSTCGITGSTAPATPCRRISNIDRTWSTPSIVARLSASERSAASEGPGDTVRLQADATATARPPRPTAVSTAAASQVSRRGASDERIRASPASLSSFKGEYFVTPAIRA